MPFTKLPLKEDIIPFIKNNLQNLRIDKGGPASGKKVQSKLEGKPCPIDRTRKKET